MTDTEIKQLAEEYIDNVVAETGGEMAPDERRAAVERIEAASRELAMSSRAHGDSVAC